MGDDVRSLELQQLVKQTVEFSKRAGFASLGRAGSAFHSHTAAVTTFR